MDFVTVLKTLYEGADEVRKAVADYDKLEQATSDLGDAPSKASVGFEAFGKTLLGLVIGGGAIYSAREAFQKLRSVVMETMRDIEGGSELLAAEEKFSNLADTIGTTSDVLLGDMQRASRGMASDAQLVASANELMSLKLATSRESVVRLSAVSSQLNWDMQVLGLTINNLSFARLDTLGLAVSDVKPLFDKYRQTMEDTAAMAKALAEAGEAKIQVIGDAAGTAAGGIQKLKVAYENLNDAWERGNARAVGDDIKYLGDQAYLASKRVEPLVEEMGSRWARTLTQGTRAAIETFLLNEAIDKGVVTIEEYNTMLSEATVRGEDYSVVFIELNRRLDEYERAQMRAATATMEGARAMGYEARAAAERRREIEKALEIGRGANMSGDTYDLYPEAAQKALDDQARDIKEIADAAERAHRLLAGDFFKKIVEDADPAAAATMNLADEMWNMVLAAEGSPEAFAAAGIAAGEFTEEMAEAYVKTAMIRAEMEKVAELVANGDMTWGEAMRHVQEYSDALDVVTGEHEVTIITYASTDEIDRFLQRLNEIPGKKVVEIVTVGQQYGSGGYQQPGDDYVPDAEQRAIGGPMWQGQPYWVGDNGPELIVPSGNAQAIPGSRLGGGTTVAVTLNVYGNMDENMLPKVSDGFLEALQKIGVSV